MLAAIRRFAKSWVALVLIGLLIVSFAIFGINDVFRSSVRDAVITAGDRSVSTADYRRAFEEARRRAEAQFGQPVTAETAAQAGLDRQLLDSMAAGAAMGELLHRLGIRPSGRLVAQQIQKTPAFFDPITGAFDKEAYEGVLRQNNTSPAEFEAQLRDDIAQQHLGSAIAAGFMAPRAYAALAVMDALEERDAAFLVLPPSSVPPPSPPSEAQLTQFMNENRAQLTRPEYRILTLVRFTPSAADASVPISEAEVKARFDYRKDTLAQPETRSLVQIPAKDAAAARAIAERLRRGEEPAAVARALRVEPVTYEDKPKTAIADRKAADAAFALAAGQVSGPVQGDLGLSVIKVTEVTPGRAPTLEERREVIEAELRQEAAAKAVYEKSEIYEAAHLAGATLPEAAKKAGVPTVTLAPVSREGQDPQGQPVQGVTPQMLQTAFDLPLGGESDLQDNGQGEYYAIRVERIVPSAMPPLAEIRDELTRAWMMRQTEARMRAKADELAGRLRRGDSLEAVAAAAGAQPSRAIGLTRRSAGQNATVPPPIVERIFSVRPGETFVATGGGLAIAVGRLEAVRPPQVSEAAQFIQIARPQLSPAVVQDLAQALQRAARKIVKVEIDAERARTALGLDPLSETAKPGAGGTETGE